MSWRRGRRVGTAKLVWRVGWHPLFRPVVARKSWEMVTTCMAEYKYTELSLEHPKDGVLTRFVMGTRKLCGTSWDAGGAYAGL